MASGSALVPLLPTGRRYGFDLRARPESVGQARRLVMHRLAGWGFSEETGDTAALVVSELVTNAVVHACGDRVRGELSAVQGVLRISVQDGGRVPDGPRLCRAPQGEHGRGLLLVDAVSTAWGVQTEERAPGRTVWAELPC
ncbi:ATP-binding protein [Streptomyces sp. NPDC050738]|uniref:ATP-binding protein n=1 Tax=Streptomyces sp. NPDC050738 TaxID=3154744 RepID=UPI0034498C92